MKTLLLLSFFFILLPLLSSLKRIPLTRQPSSYQKHHKKGNITHFTARLKVYDFLLDQYSATIKLGSDLTSFIVILDTGAPYLWVGSNVCSSCSKFGLTQFFDCSSSSSCDDQETAVTLTYGASSIKGGFVEDTVQIGEYTAEDQKFLLVSEMTGWYSMKSNGILGLGSAALGFGLATPLMDNLKSEGQISENVFSFYLGGRNDSYVPQFTIDGYDEQLIQNGSNLTYCTVTDTYYWAVTMGNLIVKGNETNYSLHNSSSTKIYEAIIDSGSSLNTVDASTYSALLTTLNLYANCSLSQGYILCYNSTLADYPDIVVTLCGNEFVLNPTDYLEVYNEGYLVLIEATKSSSYFSMGDPFMRKFYTVFDAENSRIGFALAARGGQTIEWEWAFGSRNVYGGVISVLIGVFVLLG